MLRWFVLFNAILPPIVINSPAVEHEYHIQEEVPVGSKVGNLLEDVFKKLPQTNAVSSSLTQRNPGHSIKFRIKNMLETGARLFEVNDKGDLLVLGRIDREELCPVSIMLLDLTHSSHYVQPTSEIFRYPIKSADLENYNSHGKEYCHILLKIRADLFTGTDDKSIEATEPHLDIYIRVIVGDINDNAPQWPGNLHKFHVQFRDGDPIGERRTIPPAYDADVGINAKVGYEICSVMEDGSNNEYLPFSVVSQSTNGIALYATKPIDREEKEFYQILLKAVDMAEPNVAKRGQLTSTLTIDVQVEDINDNTPMFNQPIYTPSSPIPETVPVGTVVLVLNATDADSDLNGAVVFGHSKDHTWLAAEATARKYFDVRPTGEIVVRKALNVDRPVGRRTETESHTLDSNQHIGSVQQFRFRVTVEDRALRPYTRSSEATVVIMVADENDESPVVRIQQSDNLPSSGVNNHLFGYLSVMENQPAGTAVAIVQTYDPDFEGTDHVECSVDSVNFTLIPVVQADLKTQQSFGGTGWNLLQLQTTTELDRESTAVQQVILICADTAGHVTEQKLLVRVSDQNDNKPQFIAETFHMEVEENAPVGTILRNFGDSTWPKQQTHKHVKSSNGVLAVDADSGANAEISYNLLDNGRNASGFAIDQRTGTISTSAVFDRETEDEFTVQVVAKDHGHPSLSGTTNIKITIRDVNDNAPQFRQNDYIFHLLENQPRSTRIGQVNATDRDSTTNGGIHYYLSTDQDAEAFRMDPVAGILRCWKVLDRESQSTYTFRVLARDGIYQNGLQSSITRQLTGTATVTVIVDDENDNWPVFVSPNVTANTLAIAVDDTLGHKLAYLQATDADDGENGLISYYLRAGNTDGLFGLDANTGLLYLAGLPSLMTKDKRVSYHTNSTDYVPVTTLTQDFYILTLEACDHGPMTKRKCTTFHNLKILIKRSQNEQEPSERSRTIQQVNGRHLTSDQLVNLRSNNYPNQMASDAAFLSGWQRRPSVIHTTNEIVVICLAALFLFVLMMTVGVLFLLKRNSLKQLWKQKAKGTNNQNRRPLWQFKSFLNRSSIETPVQTTLDPVNDKLTVHLNPEDEPKFPLGNYSLTCAYSSKVKSQSDDEINLKSDNDERSDETIADGNTDSISHETPRIRNRPQIIELSEPATFANMNKNGYQLLNYLGHVSCSPVSSECYGVTHKVTSPTPGSPLPNENQWTSRSIELVSSCAPTQTSPVFTTDLRVLHSRSRSHPSPMGYIGYAVRKDLFDGSTYPYGIPQPEQPSYTTDSWSTDIIYGPDDMIYRTPHATGLLTEAAQDCMKKRNMCATRLDNSCLGSTTRLKNQLPSADFQQANISQPMPSKCHQPGIHRPFLPETNRSVSTIYNESSFV